MLRMLRMLRMLHLAMGALRLRIVIVVSCAAKEMCDEELTEIIYSIYST